MSYSSPVYLRKNLRARRRGLDSVWRRAADHSLINRVRKLGPYRRARRIALYLAFDGEPDLRSLIRDAAIQRKELYVPQLRGEAMQFVRLGDDARLRHNTLGIAEPEHAPLIAARQLDLVLTPLVAFDAQGTRVGVGGGYYDRYFAFLRTRTAWLKPKLVGVGYEFQHVPAIERQPWDIPLWAAVTETATHRFPQGQ